MGTKERLFGVIVVFVEAFAILVFANGCARPQPTAKAALAPQALTGESKSALIAAILCPAGYKPVSRHDGRTDVERGHGFVIVPYTQGEKEMYIFCTQDDGKLDPRVSRSASGSIPESK